MAPNSLNLEPWLSRLSIVDKAQNVIPLKPNWMQQQIIQKVQEKYNAGEPIRIIGLKARQLGFSSLTEALVFSWATLFPSVSGFIVAHTAGSSIYLFEKIKFFYESWGLRDHYPTRKLSAREIAFDNNSSIRVQTARSPDALRGRTISFAHCSEVAFWDRQEEMMLAMRSAVPHSPGTAIICESTANGIGGWFHDTWQAAEAGKVDYVPMFFPWFTHYEYIPCHGLKCVDGTCEVCEKQSRIKPQGDEENRLLKLGCDLPHLAWRRWAIANVTLGSEDFFR